MKTEFQNEETNMNNKIYAVVKSYKPNGKECEVWEYKPDDHYEIYNRMMLLTDNDHEISADAASWCELATVGETYGFRGGEIEIQEIN